MYDAKVLYSPVDFPALRASVVPFVVAVWACTWKVHCMQSMSEGAKHMLHSLRCGSEPHLFCMWHLGFQLL